MAKASDIEAPPRISRSIVDLDRETTVDARDDGNDRYSLDLVQDARRVSFIGTVPQLDALVDLLIGARAAGYRF
jgi:hypothetical protein